MTDQRSHVEPHPHTSRLSLPALFQAAHPLPAGRRRFRAQAPELDRHACRVASVQELDLEFRTMVRALSERRFIPAVLREPFAQFEPNAACLTHCSSTSKSTETFRSTRPEARG
jgi:hypothetical protein